MNPRTARWLAWSIAVTFFFLSTAGLILQAITNAPFAQSEFPVLIILIALVDVWIITGALIISRHPQNPVGWLLCVGLFVAAFDMLAAGYEAYDTYLFHASLPGVELALVWLKLDYQGPIGLAAFTLIVLLFPDGKFSSSSWRKVAWTTIGALLLFLPLQAVEPGPVDPFFLPSRTNPLGIDVSLWVFLKPLMWTAFSILALCYGAAFLSLIVRLRNSRGDVRQQIKWPLFPVGLYGVFLTLFFMGNAVGSEFIIGISIGIGQLAVAGIVIAIAFAIFKYRLYDVDLIIRRTLAYSLLTGMLTLLYFSGVVLLQNVLTPGSRPGVLEETSAIGESPQIAVVFSTLMIAALFTPLRQRIQAFIDRRFYRQKYDAEAAFAEFAEVTRRETDLIHLTDLLAETVQETLQPEQLSLWLVTVQD